MDYNIALTTNVSTPVDTGYTFKQGDYGMKLNITVSDYDTTGTTARLVFRRADTSFVEYTVNAVNGVYTHEMSGLEVQVVGITIVDLKFYKNGVRESTSAFKFTVEKDTYNSAVIGGAYSDSLETAIEEATERANDAAKLVEDLAIGVLPIANNQSTNVAGYVLDARQANASIAGTLGEKVEQNKQSITTLNNNLALISKYFSANLPYSNNLASISDIVTVTGKNGKVYSEIGNAPNPNNTHYFVIETHTYGAVTLLTAQGSDNSLYTATYINNVFSGWIAK